MLDFTVVITFEGYLLNDVLINIQFDGL